MGGILGTTANMAEPLEQNNKRNLAASEAEEVVAIATTTTTTTAAAAVVTVTTNEEPCPKKQRLLDETPTSESVADVKKESTDATAATAAATATATATATAATATATATAAATAVADTVVNRGGKSNKTTSSKNNNNKIKTKHMDPRILKVRRAIQEGCRTNNLHMAMIEYEEAIKDDIRIEAQSYYNLLNLCDGLDREERGLHVGSPKIFGNDNDQHQNQKQNQKLLSLSSKQEEKSTTSPLPPPLPLPLPPIVVIVDLKKRQEYIFKIKNRMQSSSINLSLNETAYSAIIKILSKNKEFKKAEEILIEAENVQQCKPKLRLYSSLLYAYCEYYNNNDNNNDNDNDNDNGGSNNDDNGSNDDNELAPKKSKISKKTKLLEALYCWKRLRQRAMIIKQNSIKKATSYTTSIDTGMDLTEREYLSLMKCSILSNNNLLMEDILTRLAEDIPVPCKNSILCIIEWFNIQNNQNQNQNQTKTKNQIQNHTMDITVQQLLDEIRSYDTVSEPSPRMGPVHVVGDGSSSSSSWIISNTCSIDTKTGILQDGCLKGYTLQPVPLSDGSFNDMIQMNELIVVEGQISGHVSKFQGGKKGKKRNNNNKEDKLSQQQHRQKEWKYFNDFLIKNCCSSSSNSTEDSNTNSNSNYDVVIDGANIGYYKQNFMNSPHHVNYEQIDWIVRYFTYTLNKRVLLVMHNRHFSKRMLPTKYQYIVDFWISNNILYQTPGGMNDDWFWMHAALKYKSLVVTNDEMRDHHFQMLAPKFFLRWKERHQIHFDFGNNNSNNNNLSSSSMVKQGQQHSISSSSNSNSRQQREIILKYPNVYSRRIQRVGDGLVVPLTKVGDENRFLDGCHVASDEEPTEELYLCIRPTSSTNYDTQSSSSN